MQIATTEWIPILLVLLGVLPYAVYLTLTALKRRWKALGIQIGVALTFITLLLAITVFTNPHAFDRHYNDFFDTDVVFADPVFSYQSEQSFLGDGASIHIYRLPDQIRRRFENIDSQLMSEFPKRPHYRSDWRVVTWKEAPFDTSFEKYLEFALLASSEHSKEIREALSHKGTFYSFFHSDHGSSPGNIDFFIVDLVGGRLYEINVNT